MFGIADVRFDKDLPVDAENSSSCRYFISFSHVINDNSRQIAIANTQIHTPNEIRSIDDVRVIELAIETKFRMKSVVVMNWKGFN